MVNQWPSGSFRSAGIFVPALAACRARARRHPWPDRRRCRPDRSRRRPDWPSRRSGRRGPGRSSCCPAGTSMPSVDWIALSCEPQSAHSRRAVVADGARLSRRGIGADRQHGCKDGSKGNQSQHRERLRWIGKVSVRSAARRLLVRHHRLSSRQVQDSHAARPPARPLRVPVIPSGRRAAKQSVSRCRLRPASRVPPDDSASGHRARNSGRRARSPPSRSGSAPSQ